jgi:hypothetical protein
VPTLYLGNPFPIFNGRPTVDPTAITKVSVPADRPFATMVRDVVHEDGLWQAHSAGQPSWVESDDPALAEAVSAHYGCPVGRPTVKEEL